MKFLLTISLSLLLGSAAAYAQEAPVSVAVTGDQVAAQAASQEALAAEQAAAEAADKTAAEEASPQAATSPDQVHAVMFEVTIDRYTGVWTHAQVIGGYKDNAACTRAVLPVAAVTSGDLGQNDIPVFLCPDIDLKSVKDWQVK